MALTEKQYENIIEDILRGIASDDPYYNFEEDYVYLNLRSSININNTCTSSMRIPRFRNSALKRFFICLKERGPKEAIRSFITEFIKLDQNYDHINYDLTAQRCRVEHWNRIEGGISQNPAVLEAWEEFRVHYKLSTGEDLPNFKDI